MTNTLINKKGYPFKTEQLIELSKLTNVIRYETSNPPYYYFLESPIVHFYDIHNTCLISASLSYLCNLNLI